MPCHNYYTFYTHCHKITLSMLLREKGRNKRYKFTKDTKNKSPVICRKSHLFFLVQMCSTLSIARHKDLQVLLLDSEMRRT